MKLKINKKSGDFLSPFYASVLMIIITITLAIILYVMIVGIP